MEVAVPVLTDARCRAKYSLPIDTSKQICAGETGTGQDSCQVNYLNIILIF
jgi:hypothetical protein